MRPLAAGATRDEVLAWLDDRDRDQPSEHTFPDVPLDFVGCVSCHCGEAIGRFGPIDIGPTLEAQSRAGEEDQSMPGWDFGP